MNHGIHGIHGRRASWWRSRLFWLGVPGLVFLVWAWCESNQRHHRVFLVPSTLSSTQGKVFWHVASADHLHEVEVDFRSGRVGISKLWPEGSFATRCGVPVPRWMTYATRVKPTERCWMAALDWDAEEIDDENWYYYLSLPYWLLVGSYGALWLGGVMLWQLRKARLSRGEPGDA